MTPNLTNTDSLNCMFEATHIDLIHKIKPYRASYQDLVDDDYRDEEKEGTYPEVTVTERVLTARERKVLGKELFATLVREGGEDAPVYWDAVQAAMERTKSRRGNTTTTTTPTTEEMLLDAYRAMATTCVVLDERRDSARRLLRTFDGKLCDVSPSLTAAMRTHRPSNLGAAKVGDFNENLSYSMLQERGLRQVFRQQQQQQQQQHGPPTTEEKEHEQWEADLAVFEETLAAAVGQDGVDDIEYQGSFMKTDATMPQPAHVDFAWEYLRRERACLFVAFFPLTEHGMFLQLWEDDRTARVVDGTLLYIPHGKMLLLPSDTIHGGGFKSDRDDGNLRFHLYVAITTTPTPTTAIDGGGGGGLPRFQKNAYTEEGDRRRELCDRCVDAPGLARVRDFLFED